MYDINGREAEEAEIALDAVGPSLQQYIFCSSAGVYKKSEQARRAAGAGGMQRRATAGCW